MELKKILVVDDEDFIRDTLADKLLKSGFNTIKASDGEEAIAIALKDRPDLIVLDIVMAKMDGMTAMKKIREDAWGATVPIILLTQMEPDDQMLQEIVESRPTYYLVKNKFSLDEVVQKVKDRLTEEK
jgi:two-component system, OmpR family, response regulator VicR